MTEETSMTTAELAELFLAALCDLADAAPHPYFMFSMNDFAARFGVTDPEQLKDAINLLGDKNLVYCASFDWQGISAGLTLEGSVFVDEGGETGIIGRYRKDPASFLKWTPPDAEPEMPSAGTPQPVDAAPAAPLPERALQAVITAIAAVSDADPSLTPDAKKDLLQDLETLASQLGRANPNKPVIVGLLDSLSATPSIGPLVTQLRQLLGSLKA